MPNLTLAADLDAFLATANDAAARTELGLTALATTTPGTGVATALGVNIGSAGAPVLFNGAGGTPTSLVGTNISGTAAGLTAGTASAVAVGGITGLGTGVGTFLATPSGANLATALTTALPATKGGTGLTSLGTGVATAFGVNVNAGGGLIALADPGADRIVFWDDSAGAYTFLTVGSGLDLTNTTLTATGSGSGDVVGPASSTENAIAIYGDTSGTLLEDTSVTITGGNTVNATNVVATGVTTTTFLPVSNDGAAIGASGTAWSDLFLASGAVINFNAGNLTLTHSAGLLTSNGGYSGTTITGSSTITGLTFVPTGSSAPTNGMYLPAANTLGWAINSAAELQLTGTALSPAADGGSSLGTTALGWQNIFGNTGFVLNIENGNWVATHTSAILTVGTGDLRVTTAGTDTASVVTVGGTQTLTAKTLSAPIITYAVEPGTDDTAPGERITGILAGDTIAQWDLVYLDSTSGRWELADSDAVATGGGVLLGLAVASGTDGGALTVLVRGIVRNDGWTWASAGLKLYSSGTPGGLTVTQPSGTDDVQRPIADTLSDDCIWFAPGQFWTTHV